MTTASERLKDAADKLHHTLVKISYVEETLAALMKEKNELESSTLVAAMQEVGISSFKMDDGSSVKLGLMASGSLPKEPAARKEAIAWLVANGFEDTINVVLESSWARGDHAKAMAAYDEARKDNSAKVVLEEGCHASTLGKICREAITEGRDIPLDKLGVSVFSRAKMTVKKTQE